MRPISSTSSLATRMAIMTAASTEYNDALNRFERTKVRKAGEPNPWIVGKGEVQTYLTVVEECAKAWLAIGDGRP